MDLEIALRCGAQVEEFLRRHHIGLLTLVFTDIVGSTRLKQELGDREGVAAIQRHHAVVREILGGFKEGEEISTAGDSFFLVFAKPSDAVKFALLLQTRLQALAKETARPVFDRIGIHVGEVLIEGHLETDARKNLYGIQVDAAARTMSLGRANQVLLTRFVFDSARQVLKGQDFPGIDSLSWLNHGLYRFKGIEEPLEICEVGETGTAPLSPPANSEKAERSVSSEGELVMGWRPALDQIVPNTKWVLESKLGEGGFGEVWVARHDSLKEQRVFKFCFQIDRVRSLKREVTLFRILKERVGEHPNIVGIQDVYFDQPPFYIIMDYAEGRDLRSWCEEQGGIGKVPLEARLEIVAQVADALQAAHTAGVIHRDIKPSNIIVSAKQAGGVQVKLTDFGIGQVVSAEALAGMTQSGFTQTMLSSNSAYSGTYIYMAPELLAGKPASTASDVYSLGVVLYQLLLGDFSRPLTSDWGKDLNDPLLREDLVRCVAGDPSNRFPDTGGLSRNLRALGDRRKAVKELKAAMSALDEEQAARRAGNKAEQKLILVRLAALGSILLAVTVVAMATIGLHSLAGSLRFQDRMAEDALYVSNLNLASRAIDDQEPNRARNLLKTAFRHAFMNNSPPDFELRYLWARCGAGLTTNRVETRFEAMTSPGRFLGSSNLLMRTRDGSTLECWSLTNERTAWTSKLPAGGGLIGAASISNNGELIALASTNGDVGIWNLADSKPVLTLRGHTREVETLAFSSGARSLLTGSRGDRSLRLWNLADRVETIMTTNFLGFGGFSSDNKTVAFCSRPGSVDLWDVASKRVSRMAWVNSSAVSAMAISPFSQILATGHADGSIEVVSFSRYAQTGTTNILDPTVRRPYISITEGHKAALTSLAFSSDGRNLAASGVDRVLKFWRIQYGFGMRRDVELMTLKGWKDPIWSMQFSQDGNSFLIQSGAERHGPGLLQLWRVPAFDSIRAAERAEIWR